MPALVWNRPTKPQFKVFESGSILYFLARTFDKEFKYHFDDEELEQAMLDWIFWSQANLGPNQGNVRLSSLFLPSAQATTADALPL